MVSFLLWDPQRGSVAHGRRALLERWREAPESFLWIDVAGELDDDTATMLRAELGLHRLALQDAGRERHPPKLEVFADHTFVIYKGLSADSDDIDCRNILIAMFVGERFFVTRHSDVSPSIDRLRGELEASPAAFAGGPGDLAVRLSRFIVERYLRVLLAFEPRLELLEDELLGNRGEAVLRELVEHKSSLSRLQRVFGYQSAVTSQLRNPELPGFSEAQVHAINDVHEQQDRAASFVALFYQLASDLIEGYISVSSHRLNQIMRVLTIVTVVFVPLSFMAGIYGMNFQYMPELNSRWGYFVLLAVMATVATTLLLTFRRKRWL